MRKGVVIAREESEFEASLLRAFDDYARGGICFSPADWRGEFRKLVEEHLSFDSPFQYNELLLTERFRLIGKLLPRIRGININYGCSEVKRVEHVFDGFRITDEIEPPYVEFKVKWGRISHEGNGLPAGILISGPSSDRVVDVYAEEILERAFANRTYMRLWKAYKRYQSLPQQIQKAGAEMFRRIMKRIEEFRHFNYLGKSFPSFPGIIRDPKIAIFPAGGVLEKFYSVPLYGEGWDKERSVLRTLLEHKGDRAVFKFLDTVLGVGDVEVSELDALFDMQETIIEKVNEGLLQVIEKGEIKGLKVLPVYVHSGNRKAKARIVPAKVSRVSKATFLVTVNGNVDVTGLEGFLTELMANAYYLPKEVSVYLQGIDYNVRREDRFSTFINLIKATFDSAILYAMLDGSIKLEGLFDGFCGHLIFLNFIGTDVRNSVFHDYYYHLIDGLDAMDLFYRRGAVKYRPRVNVQNLNRNYYRLKPLPHEEALSLRAGNLTPVPLYRFTTGAGGVVFRHSASTSSGAIRYFGAERVARQLKNGRLNMGLLSSSESYYTALSFRNTSTAGYFLEIDGERVSPRVIAHGVFGTSLDRGKKLFLRLLRSTFFGPTESGENVRYSLVSYRFRRDNPRGEMNSINEILSDLRNAIAGNEINIVHVQNVGNFEYSSLDNIKATFVDWDGLILSVDGVWKALGKNWDVAVLEYPGENCRVFITQGTKGKPRKKSSHRAVLYRRPLLVFSFDPLPRDEDLLALLGSADEKGKVSFAGIKRLFYSPYPDVSRNLLRPSLLLGGVDGE